MTREVQLLFFPTGGGKTEAYLGLTAYTFAIRRLQGVVGEGDEARDGTDGVAVLMRYTLRLLTAQQFQRAAALVCACELLRRERIAAGDCRWGTTPFRIGLWVGSASPRTRFEEARRQIEERRAASERRSAACCSSPLPVVRVAAIDLAGPVDDQTAAPAGPAVLQRPRRGLSVQPAPLRRRACRC